MNKKISIIVPVYKAEKYIDSCVKSIVNQSYRNLEIILVDDGSPDNCPQILDAWASKDNRLKVIHKENGGVSSARNAGLKAAHGGWVTFVDADDLLESMTIECLIRQAQKNENALVICAFDRFKANNIVENNNLLGKEKSFFPHSGWKEFVSCRQGAFVVGMLIPKTIIIQNEVWFDEDLENLEDVAWTGRLFNYIEQFSFTEYPYYHYRINPNSITSNCSDSLWQANSWAKVYHAVSENSINYSKNRKLLYRHCLRNFFAECYEANIGYKKTNEMVKCSRGGFILWKILFFLRKIGK